MKLDVPSFLLGVATGAAAVAVAPRLRPLALEVATAAVRLADAVVVRVARRREDLQDLWAEAKARARPRWSAPPAQAAVP